MTRPDPTAESGSRERRGRAPGAALLALGHGLGLAWALFITATADWFRPMGGPRPTGEVARQWILLLLAVVALVGGGVAAAGLSGHRLWRGALGAGAYLLALPVVARLLSLFDDQIVSLAPFAAIGALAAVVLPKTGPGTAVARIVVPPMACAVVLALSLVPPLGFVRALGHATLGAALLVVVLLALWALEAVRHR